MTQEFIPYKIALELKALGFDEPCFGFYLAGVIKVKEYKNSQNKNTAFYNNTVCSAPTFSQAFRFFREKYELFHSTNYQDDNSGPGCFDYEILDKRGKTQVEDDGPEFKTYEEAELACLVKLIEIVKEKKL